MAKNWKRSVSAKLKGMQIPECFAAATAAAAAKATYKRSGVSPKDGRRLRAHVIKLQGSEE